MTDIRIMRCNSRRLPMLANATVLFIITASLIGQSVGLPCPTGCTCIQRTVRCIRQRLTEIPAAIPADTTILDLRFNQIHEITSNAFKGLPSLHTIFLSENQIGLIHENAFRELSTLKYLYLNSNRISKISPDAFQGLNQLQSLYLESNDIWEFDVKTFNNLPQLNRLFLSKNKITEIPEGSFRDLPALKRLRLDNNPIECDCSILTLMQYYKYTRSSAAIVFTCASPPKFYKKNFNKLFERHFHCKKPEIMEQPHNMEVGMGEMVELPCVVVGDPQPQVVWMQNSAEIDLERDTVKHRRVNILENGSLRIENVLEQDVGIYECMARNQIGQVKSRPARMIINHPSSYAKRGTVNDSGSQQRPHFILPPIDLKIKSNEAVILHCLASGIPQPNIHWYFNGLSISQSTELLQIHANGTLIIERPTERNSGTYKCEAINPLGTISTSASVQVNASDNGITNFTTPITSTERSNLVETSSILTTNKIAIDELPKIILAPETQTVKTGTTLILECDAEGKPQPRISWMRNGSLLTTTPSATNRISFQNENTELEIEHVKESDTGHYMCIAENHHGRTEASAMIIVENVQGPPRLIFEPYDMEVLPGTAIELPCKGEGDPTPQVKWRKDGRTLSAGSQNTNGKYRIAPSGSLFVSNITQTEGGRYECSIVNEFGRATASGLVTVKANKMLAPGDRFVRIAFGEASSEIDAAINHTVDYLFSSDPKKEPKNHGELFTIFRFPQGQARQLARAAEIYERTLVNIRKHVNAGNNLSVQMEDYEYKELLSPEHLNLVAELSGCMTPRRMPNCTDMCFHSKYRTIDGTCNNLNHPMWGSSLTGFRRIKKPIYENGVSTPVGWTKSMLYNGFKMPSARLISTTLISTKEITQDRQITHMVMQWGQFLDHDLDHAIPSVSSESWDGIDCKRTCEYAAPCYPIDVPPNDPRVKNRRCIDLVRSSAICGSGMTSVFFDEIQPREQINQLTSYIDASQVYGYSEAFAHELRDLTSEGGRLRTGVLFPNQKEMLPFAAPQDGIDCRRNVDESNINCFVAGDIRVNEQTGLLAMHIIWMREHNRIADKLKELNPHWDGDTLYEEARKIVGAEMQHITFKHWLPLILGPKGMEMMGEYRGYNPTVNPSIANEFATAALRFGHSLINPILHRLNESYETIPEGHLPLHKAFFSPWRLVYEGGVDPLMRGLFTVPAKLKMPNQNLNTELTEKLFHTSHAVALDLASMNIQRSRDHAIPGYNEYRKLCNLTYAEKFDDLRNEISSIEVRNKLKELYGSPSNIDIWVGGILEDVVEGGKVGPLFQCLLVEQFKRLRDGDRFYYENPSVFISEQLQEIKQTNLGRVLCDNGDNITEATQNTFILPELQNGYTKCDELPAINLYFWQDCGTCGNTLPAILKSYVPKSYAHRHKRSLRNPLNDTSKIPANQIDMETDDDEDLIDMNEERVEGLEDLVSTFQKELKKMKKRLRKLEQTCSQTNNKHQHHHCQDVNGQKRLNNEIWNQDECTKCQCKHPQITCITERCATIGDCPNGLKSIKYPGECCPQCPLNINSAPVDLTPTTGDILTSKKITSDKDFISRAVGTKIPQQFSNISTTITPTTTEKTINKKGPGA